MRNGIFICVALLGVLLLSGCSDDDYTIDRVNIDAQISENGVMHVKEMFTYTFDGSFNGMTRAIASDVKHFKAYDANTGNLETPTQNLKQLKTKYDDDDDAFKIYTKSKNEKRHVIYTYDVAGSVNKYADIADVKYAFFDADNDTDLHDVKIVFHTPQASGGDAVAVYLHADTGQLEKTNDGVVYHTSLLKNGDTTETRLLFPAAELSKMAYTKNKQMKDTLLAQENELQQRRKHLDENASKATAYLWTMLIVVILAGVFMRINHPNRYRGDRGMGTWLPLLEQTDPLFARYIDHYMDLDHESIIAGLLSLKQRGVIALQEVPSTREDDEKTFRFTLIDPDKDMDEADHFLIDWLFTETDQHGKYFLLESLVLHEEDPEKVNQEKEKVFDENARKWIKLVKKRPDYKDLRDPFRGFSILSIPTTIATLAVFLYFTKIDLLGPTAQWLMPTIFGVLAILAIFFSRNKWVLFVYYVPLVIVSLIIFSLTPAEILGIMFFAVTFVMLLINPSYIWIERIKTLHFAIKMGKRAFRKNTYPIGEQTDVIEKRLAYAIALDYGQTYAWSCEKASQTNVAYLADLPLLSNLSLTQTGFTSNNLVFIASATSGSSPSSSTSSSGGGGAGAF